MKYKIPLLACIFVICILSTGLAKVKETNFLGSSNNPDPNKIPLINMYKHEKQVMLTFIFPKIKGAACDAWIYESPRVEYQEVKKFKDGSLELYHCSTKYSGVTVVTKINPLPDAIEVMARLKFDEKVSQIRFTPSRSG